MGRVERLENLGDTTSIFQEQCGTVSPCQVVRTVLRAIDVSGDSDKIHYLYLPAANPSRSRRGESPPSSSPPQEKSRKTQDRAKLIECKVVQYDTL